MNKTFPAFLFLGIMSCVCCITFTPLIKNYLYTQRNSMKFIEVAHAFNDIEPIAARLEITRLLANLLQKASPHEAEIITSLSLGQLRPPHLGTQFNLAEKSLIKAVAEFLSIPLENIKKEMLLLGDIGLVLAAHPWTHTQELSVTHVYDALCKIEEASGTGSQEEKMSLLHNLFSELDPLSAKFVARIVIGKLRLGFSDMTIIDALSWMEAGDKSLRPALEDAYNICADIGFIAHTLKKDGIDAIKHMHIKLGTPILPAAAERMPTAQALFEKLGTCFAATKT